MATAFDGIPFDLTVEMYLRMIETGLIPADRRLYLQSGRLFEKMAKTKAYALLEQVSPRFCQKFYPMTGAFGLKALC